MPLEAQNAASDAAMTAAKAALETDMNTHKVWLIALVDLLLTFAQATLVKSFFGMAGAAILYLMMPPEDPKTKAFNKVEFAYRMAVAGFFSVVFGDWFVAVLDGVLPVLKASAFPKPFYLIIGAPGWYVSRGVALWLYRRRDKDIGEMITDGRNVVKLRDGDSQ